MPKIKPILFNTEMVKAILDGRKTVTRRVCKITVNGGVSVSHNFCETCCYPEVNKDGICANFFNADNIYVGAAKPPCQPGDILYVRETWNYGYFDSSDEELCNATWFEAMPIDYDGVIINCHYVYRADYTEKEQSEMGVEHDDGSYRMDWRPSIHMPKEAARIFLRVTNVRVERLQDIDEGQARKEGFLNDIDFINGTGKSAAKHFADLWDSTVNPDDKYGWIANPWVWVIEFERINREDI